MIIVSQDKKDIINFEAVKGISVQENKIIAIGQFIIAEEDGGYILGKYDTEGRAKEVLQEIISEYRKGVYYCKIDDQEWSKYLNTYEMPEE